jgi:hypothetical protein
MKKQSLILTLIICFFLFCGCEKIIIPESGEDLNMEDFEVAWQTTAERYPYFDLKNVDWDALYVEYYPKAAASQGDEIYPVLIDLFSHLKDGHMYLELEGGQQMIPWIPLRRKKDLYAFNAALIGRYFNEPVITCEEQVINYQILPQNIGYLNIRSFSGEYYLSELPQVFRYFSNTIGIIVDIRHNYGGDIHNVDKLVRNFIETPIPRNPYYYNFQPIEMDSIYPGGSYPYKNPGVLLINGVSYSASEITTEIFKQKIPQVTVAGDTTGGGSLGYLNAQNNGDFRLPSGKLFHIGNLDVRKYNNEPFENIGIVPDILVPQSKADIDAGHDRQLEFAIAYLLSK